MGLVPLDERGAVSRYSRQDVLRILRLHAKQIVAWERAGLIETGDSYSFQDLVKLRKLRDLRANRVSVANIRASVDAMQAVSGMSNPLLEATAIATRFSGALSPFRRRDGTDRAPVRLRLRSTRSRRIERCSQHQRQSSCSGIACRPRCSCRRYSLRRAAGSKKQPRATRACCAWIRTTRRPRSISGRSATTAASFAGRRSFTAAPQSPIQDMRWRFLIWATCSTSWSACPMRSKRTARRYGWCRSMLTRTTTWLWLTSVPASAAALCDIGLVYLKLDPVGPWANHARIQSRKILSREKLMIVHRSPWVSRRRSESCTLQATAERGPGLPA